MTGFLTTNDRNQSTYPGCTKNTKQNKCQNKTNKIKQTKNPGIQAFIFKLQKIKDKEKILKEARGKTIVYRGARIRIKLNFSSKTILAKRVSIIFRVIKKNHQLRILCSGRVSFKSEREIKGFLRQIKIEVFCCHYSHFAKNYKRNCSERKKMIQVRSSDLQKKGSIREEINTGKIK